MFDRLSGQMKMFRAVPAALSICALLCARCLFLSSTVQAKPQSEHNTAATTSSSSSHSAAGSTIAPTWSHDVAPVLYKNCATCHHPNGAGPFSLLTYADARRWGSQVLAVTQSRFMPPWLPEPGYGEFADVRRLSDRDRATIQKWVTNKMPEGDASEASAPPQFDGN